MLNKIKDSIKKLKIPYEINAEIKGRLLEKRFASYCDKYYHLAERKKNNPEAIIPLNTSYIKNKKNWGDLVIYFIDDNVGYTIKQMEPTLRKAGTVIKPDWFKWVNSNAMKADWSEVVEKANAMLFEHIFECHKNQKIDLIFSACYGDTLLTSTLKKLQDMKIPGIRFWMDDKQNFHHHLGSKTGRPGDCPKAPLFDLHWTTSKSCVNWFEQEGAKAFYLAEGADPDLFSPIPDTEFKYDVSFIGACYGFRSRLVNRLRKAGIKVACFGSGWENGNIPWEEIPRVISQSRINLGIGGIGHSFNLTCLKGRDFEVPMAGGLYLTTYNHELADWYIIGREIFCYRNIEDAIEIIRFLLNNGDTAERVRQAGYRRAGSEHTWENRYKTIFRALGILD